MKITRRHRFAAALATGGLLLAACSGSDPDAAPERVVDIEGGVCGLISNELMSALVAPDPVDDGSTTDGGNCQWTVTSGEREGEIATLVVDPIDEVTGESADYEAFLNESYAEVITADRIEGISELAEEVYSPVLLEDGRVGGIDVLFEGNVVSLSAFFLDIVVDLPRFGGLVTTMNEALVNLDERLVR